MPIQDEVPDYPLFGIQEADTFISNYTQIEHELHTDFISNLNENQTLTLGNSGENLILITPSSSVVFPKSFYITGTSFCLSTSGTLQSINTSGDLINYQPIYKKGQIATFSPLHQTQEVLNIGTSGQILTVDTSVDLGLKWEEKSKSLLAFSNEATFITNSSIEVPFISLGSTASYKSGDYIIYYDFSLENKNHIINIYINGNSIYLQNLSGFIPYTLLVDGTLTIQAKIKRKNCKSTITILNSRLSLWK